MRFYEFEAKRLLAKLGVPTPQGGVATTPEEAERIATEIGGPVVLKSQVLAGGLEPEWLAAQAAKSKEVTGYDILPVMGRVG